MRLPAEQRRTQLLEVAIEVFAERGFHATSMDDIAEAAGVTKPVLYQHFPSKRALYRELLDDVDRQLTERLVVATAGATSGRERVQEGFAAYFRFVADAPRRVPAAVRRVGAQRPRVRGRRRGDDRPHRRAHRRPHRDRRRDRPPAHARPRDGRHGRGHQPPRRQRRGRGRPRPARRLARRDGVVRPARRARRRAARGTDRAHARAAHPGRRVVPPPDHRHVRHRRAVGPFVDREGVRDGVRAATARSSSRSAWASTRTATCMDAYAGVSARRASSGRCGRAASSARRPTSRRSGRSPTRCSSR